MKKAALIALAVLMLAGIPFVFGLRPAPERADRAPWAGGLPPNCQQLIKQGVDAYYAKKIPAEVVLSALEEHCGENGALGWKSGK